MVQLKMRQLGGENIISARIAQWYKKEGDQVTKDEPLVVCESAKVTGELEAPASGTLAKIVAKAGEEVEIDAVLAIIAEPGEDVNAAGTPAAKAAPAPAPSVASAAVPAGPPGRSSASPIARRLAADAGIDISKIVGTGPGNRITEDDVKKAIKAKQAAPAAPSATPAPATATIIPLKPMRRTIAERMSQSNREAVHVTATNEVIIDSLVDLKDRINESLSTLNLGLKLSLTDFFVKAVALALKAHPRLNASFSTDGIAVHPNIDIGVAMALEEGLITLVVRGCEKKSVFQIAKDAGALKAKVKENKYTMEDISGSTFTVSNLGMYGVGVFTPIINPGEVAILGIGGSSEKFFKEDSERGFTFKQVINFSLSFDHRAVDGAPAAEFLQTLKKYIENPYSLLVE